MTEYFTKMNEDYARKHFPDGSVFEKTKKVVKRTSIFSTVFITVFAVASLWGLVWSVGRALELKAEGRDDMMGISMGICGFFGVVFLAFLVILWFIIKQIRKSGRTISPVPRSEASCRKEKLRNLNARSLPRTAIF